MPKSVSRSMTSPPQSRSMRGRSSGTSIRVLPTGLTGGATAVAATVAAVVGGGAVDETLGLKLVELLDPGTEHLPADPLDLPFVELVLVDELDDEFLLFVRAGPCLSVGVTIGAVGGTVFFWLTAASTLLADAISCIGNEPGVLDLGVNAVLKRFQRPHSSSG